MISLGITENMQLQNDKERKIFQIENTKRKGETGDLWQENCMVLE